MNETKIDYLALGSVKPSKTNPRKHFDEKYIAELTESIRKKGIKQPLSVRPDWCMGKTDEEIAKVNGNAPTPKFFEIVAGECRYRGATAVPLAEVPVIVRFLSDKETLEDQLIENLQRKDLTPVEEAQGYQRLIDEMGHTVDSIHERTGKAKRTIYGALKLLRAPRFFLKAIEEGVVGKRLGELVGRIPAKEMRQAAAEDILKPRLTIMKASPLTYIEASEMIQQYFMRSLAAAPFPQEDATLVPIKNDDGTGERVWGGACTDCPLRTGNSPEAGEELYHREKDMCMQPKCFNAKCDAQFARLQATAVAEGKKILTEDEAAEIFDADGRLEFDSPYVLLAQQPDRVEIREDVRKIPSWKSLLEPLTSKPQVAIARDPKGRVVELVDRKLAIEAVNLAAKQKGEKSIFEKTSNRSTSASSSTASSAGTGTNGEEEEPEWRRQDRKNKEIAKINFQITLASMSALIGAIDDKGPVKGFWNALIEASITHAGHDGCWLICKRLGLDPKAENGHTSIEGVQGAALEYGLTLPDDKLKLGYVVELLLSQRVKFSNAGSMGGIRSVESFKAFAELYKVDLAAVEKKVRVDAKDGKKKSEGGGRKLEKAPANAGKMHWTRKPEGEFKFNAHGICEKPATLVLPFPKTSKAKVSLLVAAYRGGWVSDHVIESGVNAGGGGGYPSTSGKVYPTLREALVQEALRVDFALIAFQAKQPVLKLFRYYMREIAELPIDEGKTAPVTATVAHDWEKITGNKYRCRGCGAAAVKHDGKILEEKAVRGKPCPQSEVKPKTNPPLRKATARRAKRPKSTGKKPARKSSAKKGGGKK